MDVALSARSPTGTHSYVGCCWRVRELAATAKKRSSDMCALARKRLNASGNLDALTSIVAVVVWRTNEQTHCGQLLNYGRKVMLHARSKSGPVTRPTAHHTCCCCCCHHRRNLFSSAALQLGKREKRELSLLWSIARRHRWFVFGQQLEKSTMCLSRVNRLYPLPSSLSFLSSRQRQTLFYPHRNAQPIDGFYLALPLHLLKLT